MISMRTQVAIVGAGPAGLLLAHLLQREGIDSVVIENRARDYVEHRVRAGVLEQGSVDLLNGSGVGARLQREGLVHHGIELRFGGRGHRIDMTELTGGRSITVYGQQEVVRDLIRARIDAGGEILFEVSEVGVADVETSAPKVMFARGGQRVELACDLIAGCDGFHGVCRASIPAGVLATFERTYPFAWLGILAAAPPTHGELIYAYHQRGFALYSMRSPDVTRLYLQVAPEEDIDNWPDARIWEDLHTRLETDDGWKLSEGTITEKWSSRCNTGGCSSPATRHTSFLRPAPKA
jgi:p-hydroxybenzoate 3-monooxygenase